MPTESAAPRYEIWLTRDDGTRLLSLNETGGFQYIHKANDKGAFWIDLPPETSTHYIAVDRRVQFWRAPTGSRLQLDFSGFVRKWQFSTNEHGITSLRLYGTDSNDLLDRRIVAYAAGTAYAVQEAVAADDAMKDIVRENLGSTASDTDRDITGYNFSVQADSTLGPTITKAYSWRNLLNVLQDMVDEARAEGTDVYFAVQPTSAKNLQFKTWINQPGRVRTFPVFGLEYGNLESPELVVDYSQEVNYVYAAGQGEGTQRTTAELSDTARIGLSIYNRREAMEDARHMGTSAGLSDAGNERLVQGEPKRTFTARLQDTANTRYGIEWAWGDSVPVMYLGDKYTCVVTAVKVRVGDDGSESIDARAGVTS